MGNRTLRCQRAQGKLHHIVLACLISSRLVSHVTIEQSRGEQIQLSSVRLAVYYLFQINSHIYSMYRTKEIQSHDNDNVELHQINLHQELQKFIFCTTLHFHHVPLCIFIFKSAIASFNLSLPSLFISLQAF